MQLGAVIAADPRSKEVGAGSRPVVARVKGRLKEVVGGRPPGSAIVHRPVGASDGLRAAGVRGNVVRCVGPQLEARSVLPVREARENDDGPLPKPVRAVGRT